MLDYWKIIRHLINTNPHEPHKEFSVTSVKNYEHPHRYKILNTTKFKLYEIPNDEILTRDILYIDLSVIDLLLDNYITNKGDSSLFYDNVNNYNDSYTLSD